MEPELNIDQVLEAEEQQVASGASQDGAARHVKWCSGASPAAGGGTSVNATAAKAGSSSPAATSLKPGFVTANRGPQSPLAGAVRAATGSPASPQRVTASSNVVQPAGLKHRQEVGGTALQASLGTGHTPTAPTASPTIHQSRMTEASGEVVYGACQRGQFMHKALLQVVPSNGARARSLSPRVVSTAATSSAPKRHPQSPGVRQGSPQQASMQGPQRSASDQDLKQMQIPLTGSHGRQASTAPQQVLPVPRLAKRTADVNAPYDDDHTAGPLPVFPAPRASSSPREGIRHTLPVKRPKPCLVTRQTSAPGLAHGKPRGQLEAPSLQTKLSAPLLYRPLEQPRVKIVHTH